LINKETKFLSGRKLTVLKPGNYKNSKLMQKLLNSTEKLISTIYEYQNYIKLNSRFINELEAEGGDTKQLKNEIAELERKISELKLMGGFFR
jgi:hypothetical protein